MEVTAEIIEQAQDVLLWMETDKVRIIDLSEPLQKRLMREELEEEGTTSIDGDWWWLPMRSLRDDRPDLTRVLMHVGALRETEWPSFGDEIAVVANSIHIPTLRELAAMEPTDA